jgi:hypothetical protein
MYVHMYIHSMNMSFPSAAAFSSSIGRSCHVMSWHETAALLPTLQDAYTGSGSQLLLTETLDSMEDSQTLWPDKENFY